LDSGARRTDDRVAARLNTHAVGINLRKVGTVRTEASNEGK
jgi:hypothetical protein